MSEAEEAEEETVLSAALSAALSANDAVCIVAGALYRASVFTHDGEGRRKCLCCLIVYIQRPWVMYLLIALAYIFYK